jgi:hypothetical protein
LRKSQPQLHSLLLLFCAAVHAGLVWWQRGQDYYGGVQAASDILGLLFFILLFPSMRALFRALFTFPNDYRQVLKVRWVVVEALPPVWISDGFWLARGLKHISGNTLRCALNTCSH